MPKRVCAIVGSHPLTRDYAPFDRQYIDIFMFNERLAKGELTENKPMRATAVFQMHAEPIWRNPTNRNDPHHFEWLQKKHTYPIYMMDKYEDVPSSVKYPLNEICAELLPCLKRGKTDLIRYFTSSVNYALALAIYQKYDSIQIYGVEMETNTEYTYQRDGVFFWIGVALGRGIEVVIHEKAKLFTEPLYGYEGDVTLHRADFEIRIGELTKLFDAARARVEAATKLQIETLERIERANGKLPELTKIYFGSIKEQAQSIVDYGCMEGAIEENKRYLAKADAMENAAGANLFSRQEFEQTAAKAGEFAGKFEASMHQIGGMAETRWRLLSEAVASGSTDITKPVNDYTQAHQQYLEACHKHGRAAGAWQENVQFLKKLDKFIKAAGGTKSEEVLLGAANNQGVQPAIPDGGSEADFAQAARVETPAPSAGGGAR